MNRYLDMTIFQCLNFGKLFSVVFIYVKPTRIYQKTLCCNLFQLGYLYMLVLLYYKLGHFVPGWRVDVNTEDTAWSKKRIKVEWEFPFNRFTFFGPPGSIILFLHK